MTKAGYDPAMSKPVLAAGLLVLAAGAWYWALLPPAAPGGVAARGAPREAAATDVPAVRLERLRQTRAVPTPGELRDPFRGGRTREGAPGAGASAAAATVTAAAATPPATPAWPRLELIGVAEGRDGAAVVRTAIVSGPRGVHHVKAGEMVEQVYRLERVTADGIQLRLLPEDRIVQLTLRP